MLKPRTFACPVCDGPVPVKAKACPHCGACDKTGWNQDATAADGLDLPDDGFDYEKFVEEEFEQPRKKEGLPLVWKITTVVLIALFVLLIFFDELFSTP